MNITKIISSISICLILISCGGGGGGSSNGSSPGSGGAATYTIGGSVVGLDTSLILSNNGSITLPITENKSFSFDTQLSNGSAYNVVISSQPAGQTCSVANGSGTVASADITNVSIICTTAILTPVPPLSGAPSCASNCYYVDAQNGSDTNNGTSANSAFQTLQKAANTVTPGSTVLVMSGTYTTNGSSDPLRIATSGTASAWIQFAAAPGQHPVVQIPAGVWHGIWIVGASYIIINGFEVVGLNQSITPQQAAANNGTQPTLNATCIFIDGAFVGWNTSAYGPYPPVPHDIVIINSSTHDCAGSGIQANVADALTIAYNNVYNNGWWTDFGNSGIDIYHLTDVAGSGIANAMYKNMIIGNYSYNNYNTLNAIDLPPGLPPGIYDGNGIIIDDNKHTQVAIGPYDTQGVPYTGRTYIANNISYNNGGRGIHVYSSGHADVVNNTTYNNLLTNSAYIICCEIDSNSSTDFNAFNNVSINLNGKGVDESDSNNYQYNLWNGASISYLGNNDLTSAANLTNPATGNFTPATSSRALSSGTSALAPSLDILGNARTAGKIDRGAIQVSQ